jgi:hypothetical protein
MFSRGNFLAFVWLYLFEFFFHFFSFSPFSELVTCVVNALIKREIEDKSVRGPVDGHSWL